MRDIIPLSLEVIHSLREAGFATVLVGETSWIFKSPLGQSYLEACYDAAARIESFVRLFITGASDQITPRMYDLIEEHHDNGVSVFAITEETIREHNLPVVDFGLWDRRYLMVIHPIPGEETAANLEVQVGGHQAEFYQRLSEDLTALATPWSQFKQDLCRPLNPSWSSVLPSRAGHPIPVGPSDYDVEVIWSLSSESLGGSSARVLVLGYTAKLVDFFVAKGCQVTVLDIGYYSPHYGEDPVRFIQGNWLTWRGDEEPPFDAIVGDDAINNLASWQYHLFFRNVASLLKPRGVLAMRAHCQYEPLEGLPTFEETFSALRDAEEKGTLNKQFVYVKTWPMFLSADFYDARSQTFDMREWDRRVSELGTTHSALKLGYPLKQSCLEYTELVEYARPWFNVSGAVPVDQGYASLDERFNSLYRIVSFIESDWLLSGQAPVSTASGRQAAYKA